MALPFHRRIFVILVTMTAVPTTLAVAGWVLSVRTLAPSAGARASFEDVVTSARALVHGVATLQLTPAGRAALRNHLERVSNSASLARRGETYLRYYTAGFAIGIGTLGALVLFAAVRLAGHLSRQLSRPIEELVGWTQLIRMRQPLPAGMPARGAPEFESLRQALRDLATALDVARDKELEAERLRAFREVARRAGAARVPQPPGRRRGGDARGGHDRRRARGRRRGARRHDRRPRARDRRSAAPAGVRAVFHDQSRRDGAGTGVGAPDDGSPSGDHHRGRDAGWRRDVHHRVRDVSPRVLLVDDESNIRRMVGALLQSEGFETAEAPNGT